jgi:hypothetical protein
LIFLTSQNLSQNTTHNLARSCLWQIINGKDCLGCSKWTNGLANLQNKILLRLVGVFVAFFERDKGVDGLSGEFIVNANDGSFGDGSFSC